MRYAEGQTGWKWDPMKTSSWIIWGLGLNVAAAVLHGAGTPASALSAGLPGLITGMTPKLILVAAGNFCLWRGLRSAVGDLWGGLTGQKHRAAAHAKSSASNRFADPIEPLSDFDADAVFARYMEQRAAQPQDEADEPMVRPERPATRTPRRPASGPPPAVTGFGRKAV